MLKFWICFVPLFVAVDALGLLPIFMGLTYGLEKSKINRIIWQSIITATIVALIFLAIGKIVLSLLNITVADFMIAGGILLFVISLNDLLAAEKSPQSIDSESLGAVPLGVPLIVGPAVLTTIILLVNENGLIPTVSATVVNIFIAGIVFRLSDPINRVLGKSGTRTISKLSSLILAAIAVMMVRKGITIYLTIGISSL
jgi:multiple antibiotic resistance protein